jgi:hypothetical protein
LTSKKERIHGSSRIASAKAPATASPAVHFANADGAPVAESQQAEPYLRHHGG